MTDGEKEEIQLIGNLLSDLAPTPPEALKLMENSRLSQKHYAAIGRVAAMWAELEIVADAHSIQISGMEECYAACFTSHIFGIANKLEAFIAIVKLQTGGVFVDRANKLAETANSLARQRNRVVHDPWLFDDEGSPKRYEISAQKTLKQQMIPVPTSQLIELSVKIENLTDDLTSLSKEILAHIEALQKKHQNKIRRLNRSTLRKRKIAQLRAVRRRSFLQ